MIASACVGTPREEPTSTWPAPLSKENRGQRQLLYIIVASSVRLEAGNSRIGESLELL